MSTVDRNGGVHDNTNGRFTGQARTEADTTVLSSCRACQVLESLDDEERFEAGAAIRWWHCSRCNRHLERYRYEGDSTCVCGAEYNAFGQLLRDGWRNNESLYNDEVDDLEGFERSQLRGEG